MSRRTKTEATVEAMRAVVHTGWVIERECMGLGLTLAQYRLLDFVRAEPVRAGALATKAEISRPNLTTIVDTLEARGWIQRERVPGDRRGVTLEVTESGLSLLRQVEAAFAERVDDLLDTAERATVFSGLELLLGALHRKSAQRPQATTG
ncbi:MAG TPA: MarR family transcriptional regulator [Acidimicrobiales bacterium]|nr:MarR family transcriptional regulator [Acidimicrobiales bacterium]